MSAVVRVIKAKKRDDIFKNGIPVPDDEILGTTKEVIGAIPEGYIKYYPGRIFDKRKYPDLYALFGKDHLPTEHEIEMYERKMLPQPKQPLWKRFLSLFKKETY